MAELSQAHALRGVGWLCLACQDRTELAFQCEAVFALFQLLKSVLAEWVARREQRQTTAVRLPGLSKPSLQC